MCQSKHAKAKTSGRIEYDLLAYSSEECGGSGDDLWNFKAQVTESFLYSVNDMKYNISYLSVFHYYRYGNTGADYDWKMFSRSYIPVKQECRKYLRDFGVLYENIDALEKPTMAIFIVICIIIPCTITYLVIWTCVMMDNRKSSRCTIGYRIIRTLIGIAVLYGFVHINREYQALSQLLDNDCL